MDDKELFNLLRQIGTYLVPIVAIIGTLFYYKYKHSILKFFLLYLWFSALIEQLGIYYRENISTTGNNKVVYNAYNLIIISYFLFLFKRFITNTKHKKITEYYIYGFWLISFINIFFQNFLTQAQTTPYIVACFFIVSSIIFYFMEILNTNKVLYLSKNLLFWISVGLLIKYTSDIPSRVMRNFSDLTYNLVSVSLLINILMYLIFTLGFLWSSKDYQY